MSQITTTTTSTTLLQLQRSYDGDKILGPKR